MFVLRKITGTGVEINIKIGDGYTLITKEGHPDEFGEMKRLYLWDDCIYGFITGRDGALTLPLSDKQMSFVMTENGSTFANVSQR